MEGHPKGSVMLAGHIRSARGWDSSCPARAGVKAFSLKCHRFVCYEVFLLCKRSHVPAGNLSFPTAFQAIILSIAKR